MSYSDKKHWAETEERGSGFGIMFLLYTFKYLGRRICKLAMAPVLLYFYLFNRRARASLTAYLSRLDQTFGLNHCRQSNVLRIFLNFGDAIVDRLSSWQGNWRNIKLSRINRAVFTELLAERRGAVILVSHLGNFEVSRIASGSYKNAKMNVFMHTKNARKITAALKKINPDYEQSLIQGDGLNMKTIIDLKEKVDAGEFVVIAGDRIPVNNPKAMVEVDFLSAKANLPIGPYVLSKVLGCPMIALFCCKQSGGYEVSFDLFAEPINFNSKNRAEVVQQYAQKYADLLAQKAGQYPLQWYNFHNFWQSED